jgi:hypothetical protein
MVNAKMVNVLEGGAFCSCKAPFLAKLARFSALKTTVNYVHRFRKTKCRTVLYYFLSMILRKAVLFQLDKKLLRFNGL